jgi:PhoH-like ATPase
MSKKNYVLDTNVLIHDPKSIFEFGDNRVILTFSTLEELDKIKCAPGDIGSNARKVIRALDELRATGQLSSGVPLDNGGCLAVVPPVVSFEVSCKSVDDAILSTAKNLANSILVTKDINLRVKADVLGVIAVDYEKDKADVTYTGHRVAILSQEQVNDMVKGGACELNEDMVTENEYFMFTTEDGTHLPFIGKSSRGAVVKIGSSPIAAGIKAKNFEQTLALDALLDRSINMVTLRAKAGSGKTLLAMAAALQRTYVDKEYKKVIVARPIVPVGDSLGFLPGTLDEKLAPWMKPIEDNLGVIKSSMSKPPKVELFQDIEVTPVAYIRGRSICNTFIIIDEAQNLTPTEIKTIVTRVGVDSKIVFTGDTSQIDKPTLDKKSSGFTYLINKFIGQRVYTHVELSRSERSELAELGANLL